ncbi:uncharacterized protein LY89DRAFT_676357 [Mollisia scopiformis]|uniref:Uncharacterized protein n=1 Tax=Mollisia scopiformis TaxID=149040 RepID=A0A132B9D6_MOLSC|nr:uncharacterized protein LY89DRAFT_676357 [Mollisia scopiformis]KUJ08981.1 hypothetical protein LY89DRAFT_676357 [Mollisia scopiformis]
MEHRDREMANNSKTDMDNIHSFVRQQFAELEDSLKEEIRSVPEAVWKTAKMTDAGEAARNTFTNLFGLFHRQTDEGDSKAKTQLEVSAHANHELEVERKAILRDSEDWRSGFEKSAEHYQNKLKEEIADIRFQKDKAVRRLKDAERENGELQKQVATFRSIIIKHGGSESGQLDDATIVARFVNLRTKIRGIVMRDCHFDKLDTATGHESLQKLHKRGLTIFDLKNQLQESLFREVCRVFFSVLAFGLEGSTLGDQVNYGLGRFEWELLSLSPGQGYQKDSLEWRLLTIKCAKLLGQPNPDVAAQRILDWLQPFLGMTEKPDQDTPSDSSSKLNRESTSKSTSESRVKQLCQDALDFALLIRTCRDRYQAERTIEREERSEQAWEGEMGSDNDPREIACMISPALVKYPGHDWKKRLVLEKSHVIVRKIVPGGCNELGVGSLLPHDCDRAEN